MSQTNEFPWHKTNFPFKNSYFPVYNTNVQCKKLYGKMFGFEKFTSSAMYYCYTRLKLIG